VNRAELQITAGSKENKVEFNQNYALNQDTIELTRFKAITSAIKEVLANHDNLPQSDCLYL
jgi:hypothetical protein